MAALMQGKETSLALPPLILPLIPDPQALQGVQERGSPSSWWACHRSLFSSPSLPQWAPGPD